MKTLLTFSLMFFVAGASINAQTEVVPIVEMATGGLLGGVQNGKWVAPGNAAAAADTEYVLVGPSGVEEGGVTIGKRGETEDVCQDFFRMELELKQDRGVAIGSTAKWNFMPRMPQKIDPKGATYKKVVADFLRKKGIARPNVQIKQAMRIDLEGDGVDEVLISATYYKDGISSHASVGEYSFVMVRKAVGRTVTDHLLKGDFVTKKVDFGAPSEHSISAVADLNGDGKMEVVLYGRYYEGEFASAFEMKAGKPVEIKEFEIGCGV